MIEEVEDRIPLHSNCRVNEVDMIGTIYERVEADSGHTIYGVQFDKTAWYGGMATRVWHCRREELTVIPNKLSQQGG